MRLKLQIEKELVQITSDLVEARLKNDWAYGRVNYLLGLAVALTMVLNPKMSRVDARQVIAGRIDRSVANIKSRPDYQEDFNPSPISHSHGNGDEK